MTHASISLPLMMGLVAALCFAQGLYAKPLAKWRVGAIVFIGNHAFAAKQIRRVMETRPHRFWRPSPYSPAKLRFDLISIRGLYREGGYLEATAFLKKSEYDSSSRRVAITIGISEGEATLVDSIAFRGETAIDRQDLFRVILTTAGKPLSPNQVKKDAAAVSELLTAKGYLRARVEDTVRIDTARTRAGVLFSIDQGPLCRSGPISVTGLSRVRPIAVRRELSFSPGDTLTSGKLRSSTQRLYGTGLFDFMRIVPSADSAPRRGDLHVPVTVALDEAKFFTIDASAGYGTYEHFRAAARTSYSNCFGLGHGISFDANANRFVQRAQAEYEYPWIFNAPFRAQASVYVERHDINYRGLFEGVRLSFVPNGTGPFSCRLWGRYEKTEYIETYSDTIIDPKNTRSIGVDLGFDGRRGRLTGKTGWLIRCSPELAGIGGGGSNQYFRGLLDLSCAYDLFHGSRFSAALCAGYTRAYGESKGTIPPQARYYIGSQGMRPIRGYAADTVGGGVALAVNPFELTFPVYKWIGAAIFVDCGQEWENLASSSLGDIRWVVGPGLVVKTAVGEFRAYFPWLLNGKTGWGPPFLSIGGAF